MLAFQLLPTTRQRFRRVLSTTPLFGVRLATAINCPFCARRTAGRSGQAEGKC
ncbi:hypothetical protein PR002_g28015 [Phytophthora rubi]|uniref:Uncharacterized protein n=1 Tax=Phytophthora rubi TaxID=129364 RepID=A0A6A3HCF6_9STRA|nr:hypothetical protein PR002_g28015 [Phytophthora rubi]